MELTEEMQEHFKKIDENIIVKDFLMYPGAYALFAGAGVGKTTLVTQLAACVASGRNFLGSQVCQSKVMYISTEMTEDSYFYSYLNKNNPSILQTLTIEELNNIKFYYLASKKYKDLINLINENKNEYRLFIIDLISYLEEYAELSEKRYVIGNFYSKLNDLAEKNNIYILCLAHTLKDNETYAGHITIEGAVVGLFVLIRKDKNNKEYELEIVKSRFGKTGSIFLKMNDDRIYVPINILEISLPVQLNKIYNCLSNKYDKTAKKINRDDGKGEVWIKIDLRNLCANRIFNNEMSPKSMGRILSHKKNQQMLATQGLILDAIDGPHHQKTYFYRFDNIYFNSDDEESQSIN